MVPTTQQICLLIPLPRQMRQIQGHAKAKAISAKTTGMLSQAHMMQLGVPINLMKMMKRMKREPIGGAKKLMKPNLIKAT